MSKHLGGKDQKSPWRDKTECTVLRPTLSRSIRLQSRMHRHRTDGRALRLRELFGMLGVSQMVEQAARRFPTSNPGSAGAGGELGQRGAARGARAGGRPPRSCRDPPHPHPARVPSPAPFGREASPQIRVGPESIRRTIAQRVREGSPCASRLHLRPRTLPVKCYSTLAVRQACHVSSQRTFTKTIPESPSLTAPNETTFHRVRCTILAAGTTFCYESLASSQRESVRAFTT